MSRHNDETPTGRDLLADALALVGLTCLAYGLWMLDPSYAFIAVGVLLLLGGVRGAL